MQPDEDLVDLVHDLKSPLTTIALEIGLLQEKIASSGSPAIRAAMARITRNVAFIDRLVHDLLDSSSLEAGELYLQRAPTELSSLLHQVIERTVPSRELDRVHLDAPYLVTLVVDPLRIERVVANLLTNALKYGPEDTAVVVRLEQIPGGARVSVIDAGPGVAEIDRKCIFDRHTRTEVARFYEGSGLGLYVARRIVEAHGGTIGVEPARPGANFYFELPAR